MKIGDISFKGRRVRRTYSGAKILPLILVAAMLSGMLLTPSVGAKGNPTDYNDQVTDMGKTVYYDRQGAETSDQENYTVSVNKMVTQGAKENEFNVDLTVEASTNYQTVQKSLDSAVIAVVDISGSMEKCAECGDYAHNPTTGSGEHDFVSRFDAAKQVLVNFLVKYAAGAGDANGWISIIAYDDYARSATAWKDFSGMTREQITAYVNNKNNLAEPSGGGTNTPDGLLKAINLLMGQKLVPANRCTVISLTDGFPNATAPTGGGNVSDAFKAQYAAALKFLIDNAGAKAPAFIGSYECFDQVAQYSFAIRALNVPLYSVLFASGKDVDSNSPELLAQYAGLVSTKSYSASNSAELDANFSEIVQQITEAKPDTVVDTLPSWLKADSESFSSGDIKSTVSYNNGVINWTLAGMPPMHQGNHGHNVYKLSYTMTLDNLAAGVPTISAPAPVNEAAPTFSYYMYQTAGGKPVANSQLFKVGFAIPKVESYTGEVTFYKTDPQGVVITKTLGEASKFELSTAGGWSREASNDGNGKVTFNNVPSGHAYTLEELRAPAGHEKDPGAHALDLAWGTVANSHIPQGIIKSADGKTTISASGSRVVNTYAYMNKNVVVQKTWVDTTDAYKSQTVAFDIYNANSKALLESGTMDIDDATTLGGTTWKVTVSVPSKDTQTGEELQYRVEETGIAGYTPSYDGLNITNTALPQTKTVTIEKIWRVPMPDEPEQTAVDGDNRDNAEEPQSDTQNTQDIQVPSSEDGAREEGGTLRTASITPPEAVIELILNATDGTMTTFDTYTLAADELTRTEDDANKEFIYKTRITVSDVPAQAGNGRDYTYRVSEAGMDGFHHVGTDMPDGTTFIVTNASDELKTTSVPFHKHWEGDENDTSTRVPVTVALYADYQDGQGEQKIDEKTLTSANQLGANENVWAGSFENLPRYVDGDVSKAKIVYSFKEITEVPGYLISYDGIDIINTWNETSIQVTKSWVKPESAVTPAVTFDLYRSGDDRTPYLSYVMHPGESAYTFAKLPLLSADKQTRYTYTVKEVVPVDYASKQVGAAFTNTIKQRYDVTVQGAIEWDLRGEDKSVLPNQVVVQLYAGGNPCVYPDDYSVAALRGEPVTRIARASDGWAYRFEKAQRYTNGLTADIAYSVRELGADEKPAPDVSTVQFQSVGDAEGTLRSFGAHYRDVTYDSAAGTFTADIFNHTDAEVAAYRVDRVYHYTLDGNATVKNDFGSVGYQEPGTMLSVDTKDYVKFDGKTYAFTAGMVSVTVDGSTEMFPPLKEGVNAISLGKTDRIYIVMLEYALSETTPPYVPDNPPPKPTVDPTPSPSPTPSVTPSPSPSETPTPEPSVSPTPEPPPEPTPKPTPPPDVRPTPPVLPPEVQDKVDEVIKDVTEHPEHIIKDKDSFEELYPEVSIEDLPPPLYWGPEFAVVDVPVYEEIVAIDSELVPLGNLPQTGSDLRTAATRTALAGMAAVLLAGSAALGGCLFRRKKYRE